VFAMVFCFGIIDDLLDGVRLNCFRGKDGERTLFFGRRTLKARLSHANELYCITKSILPHILEHAGVQTHRYCDGMASQTMYSVSWAQDFGERIGGGNSNSGAEV
jgi:hypothetical protein